MDNTLSIILAGFGGQGVLFSGKLIAYAALFDEKEVSWLPSYGPEMRGGTANCSVCISDVPIGSPLITHPEVLVVMNLPSYEKFIGTVVPGGTVLLDSSLIPAQVARTDITTYALPATELANQEGLRGLSNMILMGKLFREISFASREGLDKGLVKCIPPQKAHLLEPNQRALELGMSL